MALAGYPYSSRASRQATTKSQVTQPGRPSMEACRPGFSRGTAMARGGRVRPAPVYFTRASFSVHRV